MKEFKLFYLENCPYCVKTRQYMAELRKENPEYQSIELEMIEEREQAELANTFDYYYVSTFYLGDEKLHEGAMTKEDVQSVFDKVLQRHR